MKTIFLFGAGASYGSGGLNYQVPLGEKLYSELRKYFPTTWGSLPVELENMFLNNFEVGMEKIWKDHSNNIGILMQDMAVFFSKIYILNPDNNLYVRLVKFLSEKASLDDYVISTLNYDCLLEMAISSNKIIVRYGLDISDNKSLLIWKLHGSCNFILDGIAAKRGVNYMSGVFFNGNGLKSIQPNEVEPYCRADNALYPAMSIFMKDKPNQIGKPHIEAMQEKWKEWILNAEKIFLIGVNPHIEDSHIWGPLSESKSKVYFCGNNGSFTEWQTLKNRHDEYIGEKFEDSFDKIIAKL